MAFHHVRFNEEQKRVFHFFMSTTIHPNTSMELLKIDIAELMDRMYIFEAYHGKVEQPDRFYGLIASIFKCNRTDYDQFRDQVYELACAVNLDERNQTHIA